MKNPKFSGLLRIMVALTIFGIVVGAMGQTPDSAATTEFPEVKDLPDLKGMPDAMTMLNGQKVATPEQWRQRREEIKRIIEFYELGHTPPPPGNVTGKIVQLKPVLDGAAEFQLVRLKFGPEEKLGLDIAIFIPTNGDGPFPTFINPTFFPTPGVGFNATSATQTAAADPSRATGRAETAGTSATPGARAGNPGARRGFGFGGPVDPERAAFGFTDQLNRGYAVVTYRYTQCGEDSANYRNSSFYPAYPGYDWGVLAGWAWGLSRIVDYLETQPYVDKSKLIAIGASRLGKMTMVATAFDERISLGVPACSSGAGTGAYRFCGPGRGGGEGIELMSKVFGYYFVPRFNDFTGHIEKLPFDAYWFTALAAPRPWLAAEGTDDPLCLPSAVRRSIEAAKPIYKFLGVSEDRVGVNYAPHAHGFTADDWNAAMDFADQQLRGIDHQRRFDTFAPDRPAPAAKAKPAPAK